MELGNFTFGNSRGEYTVNRDWQTMFIEHLYDLGFDGYGMPKIDERDELEVKIKSNSGGEFYRYENETFIIMPYYWGEDDEICQMPNFVFKPKRFEINWYKYALRDSYMNQNITYQQLDEIMEKCKDSLKIPKKTIEGTFWEVCQKSNEEDVLECVDWKMQNIVNNGDYTFMWEDDWKPVALNDEFVGARWRVK